MKIVLDFLALSFNETGKRNFKQQPLPPPSVLSSLIPGAIDDYAKRWQTRRGLIFM